MCFIMFSTIRYSWTRSQLLQFVSAGWDGCWIISARGEDMALFCLKLPGLLFFTIIIITKQLDHFLKWEEFTILISLHSIYLTNLSISVIFLIAAQSPRFQKATGLIRLFLQSNITPAASPRKDTETLKSGQTFAISRVSHVIWRIDKLT